MLVLAELNSSILPRLGTVARFLVARNVMFSGKQTTARKMADQLKNCVNQGANRFYSNRIHTEGSVWITDTITNVMIHYNSLHLFTECRCSNASWVQERRSQQEVKTVVKTAPECWLSFIEGRRGTCWRIEAFPEACFLSLIMFTELMWSGHWILRMRFKTSIHYRYILFVIKTDLNPERDNVFGVKR